MRELKGDWRDLFNGFMVALDLRKCFLALLGIFVTICLCGGLTICLGNSLNPKYVEVPRDLVLHKWLNTQKQAWDVIYGRSYVEKKIDVPKAPEGAMTPPKSTHAALFTVERLETSPL